MYLFQFPNIVALVQHDVKDDFTDARGVLFTVLVCPVDLGHIVIIPNEDF